MPVFIRKPCFARKALLGKTIEELVGKYVGEGKIEEVVEVDTPYIEWCVINLEHFCLDRDVIDNLEADGAYVDGVIVPLTPRYKFSSEAVDKNWEKLKILREESHDYGWEDLGSFDAYEGDQIAWYGDND